MKKHFFIFFFSLVLCAGLFKVVLADDPNILIKIGQDSGYAPANSASLSETVGKIIRIILGLLGIIFLGLTVYAGALWMTAAGEAEKVTTATGILKMAVIGLAIILAAYSLSNFIFDRLTRSTTGNTQNPLQEDFCIKNPNDDTCIDF